MARNWRIVRGLQTPQWISIYALTDPRTDEIYYVGKTNDPQKRYNLHLSAARGKRDHYPSLLWLRQLLADDIKPGLMVLETVRYEDTQSRERWWIAELASVGCPLTNVSSGGGGPA